LVKRDRHARNIEETDVANKLSLKLLRKYSGKWR